jgi:hypothetical protein
LKNYNPMGPKGDCRLTKIDLDDEKVDPMKSTPCNVCEREVICVAFVTKTGEFELHCIGRDTPGLPQIVAPPFESKKGVDGNRMVGITDPIAHFGNELPAAQTIKKAGNATYCCKKK